MNNEIYGVIYQSGMCGAFIVSILHNLIHDEIKIPIEISPTGDVHNTVNRYTSNWKNHEEYVCNVHSVFDYLWVENTNVPLEYKNKPIILCDHVKPNYETVFKKYPNCKLVVITCNRSDYWLFIFMTLVKHDGNLGKCFKNKPYYISDNLFDYSDKEFKLYMDSMLIPNISFSPIEYLNEEIKQKYKNNITNINFYDIIFNMNKTLNLLENTVNKKACTLTIANYKQYVNKHFELFDRYLLWMNLREKAQNS